MTTTNRPLTDISPKVAAAGLAGAVTVLIVFVFGAAGVEIPEGVAAALTTVFAFVAGYLIPDNR